MNLATSLRGHLNAGSCSLRGKPYPSLAHLPSAALQGVPERRRIKTLTSGYGKTAVLQLADDQGSGELKTLKWQQPRTKTDVSYCRKKQEQAAAGVAFRVASGSSKPSSFS